MSFYNLFVSSIHSVDQQRNSPSKTLTLLSKPKTLGLTTCGVIPKTSLEAKKSFVFLDSGQLYLATVNYQTLSTTGSCEEPMQVNGAFHGIEKTSAIIQNYSTGLFIYFLLWVQNES